MFAKIKQFITENAQLLSKQLSTLEGNVHAALDELDTGKLDTPQPMLFSPQSTATQSLTTGMVALCDTGLGSVVVPLVAPKDGAAGFAWLVKRAAANSVTLVPSGMSGGRARTVNSATSKAYGVGTIGGPFALYYDGSNWWAA